MKPRPASDPPEFNHITSDQIYIVTDEGDLLLGHAHANGHYYDIGHNLIVSPVEDLDVNRSTKEDYPEAAGWIPVDEVREFFQLEFDT